MIYGSICSGIEAASVAWEPLGWRPSFFAEIAQFPRAVLEHRYPGVPLHGDFTTIKEGQYAAIDLLVGGTPCQSFSIAGLREGMDDDRGNLALEYCRLARRLRPKWVVWENVPGVLSSGGGRDFGSIIGALVQLGYGMCWRVLDAQYVRVDGYPRAVPQRRRRVFAVGCAGGAWQRAAAVLFERESLSGDPPPRREAGQETSSGIAAGAGGGGAARRLSSGQRYDAETETPLPIVFDPRQITSPAHRMVIEPGRPCYTLHTRPPAITAFHNRQDPDPSGAVTHPLGASDNGLGVLQDAVVRRLTPRECERLQGFPDDWTRVPYRGRPAERCANTPRYQAIGNSMAVNVMRWIGRRIDLVEDLTS